MVETENKREFIFKKTVIFETREFAAGDMFIFKKDLSEKGWETFHSFISDSAYFFNQQKIDQPGGPTWNDFAKFFLREFAWGAEMILNSKQIRIKNLKNRLKRKVVTLPLDCVIVKLVKNNYAQSIKI